MPLKERTLYLDICDHRGKVLCSLYDNDSKVPGQAVNVVVSTERNGWKEISFKIPSTYQTPEGDKKNHIIDYLKADNKIRLIDDNGTDWFVISEPKTAHTGFSTDVDVRAGHISQELKTKNLGLQFSDEEGNNVGTAKELLETILSGTGWTVGYVYPFAELRTGETKYRSLIAQAKTGAFKLITALCDLFEGKPIFHGDTKTVDILPMNPFSEYDPGKIPDLSLADGVIELHYGVDLKNVTRTLNTETIVTKLYAYGSYGDKTSGYCNIDICYHKEFSYLLSAELDANSTYYFTAENKNGQETVYNFTTGNGVAAGRTLIYSMLDPASMMYIWNNDDLICYEVKEGTKGTALPCTTSVEELQNWFSYLLDFSYYKRIGMFDDNAMQTVAEFQRNAPEKFREIYEATGNMADSQTELAEVIGSLDFCRLAIESKPSGNTGYLQLKLDKDNYEDGVIYRTDYMKSSKNRFEWRAGDKLDDKGDPVNPATAMLLILHDTSPISWDKFYLKDIDEKDNPSVLTFWAKSADVSINVNSDQFYLFSYNGINGLLGALESSDEAAQEAIKKTTTVVTEEHDVIFSTGAVTSVPVTGVQNYGWMWRYDPGGYAESELYFCWKAEGDSEWKRVYVLDRNPGSNMPVGTYWYNWRDAVLYRRNMNTWTRLDTYEQERVAAMFGAVYNYCKVRDRYLLGVREFTTYTTTKTLEAGNYYFENKYNSYWAFSTPEDLPEGSTITYNYIDGWVTLKDDQDVETSILAKHYRFDNVNYHPTNILENSTAERGYIDNEGNIVDVELSDNTHARIANFAPVIPNTDYVITGFGQISLYYYTDKKTFISSESVTENEFTVPGNCFYIRFWKSISPEGLDNLLANGSIYAADKGKMIIMDNINYYKLSPLTSSGDNIGIISLMERFKELVNLTYDTYYVRMKNAQAVLDAMELEVTTDLGSLLREGWWQDDSYVKGKETELYLDALDNLEKISEPETKYTIDFLDLYSSNKNDTDYSAYNDHVIEIPWPDINIASAVHLIDAELDINVWGFIDKIQKCYDKPWETSIEINTNLTAMNQHSFTDVMTHIADVASSYKGNMSAYDATANTSVSYSDLQDIFAQLNQTATFMTDTNSAILEISDNIGKTNARITLASNEISAQVVNSQESIQAMVNIAADNIYTEVEQALDEQDTALKSLIQQTATGIMSQVSIDIGNEDVALKSLITQTAAGIRSDVSQEISGSISTYDVSVQSSISQTASQIRSEVSASIADSESSMTSLIQQSADEILIEVQDQIEDEVSSAVAQFSNQYIYNAVTSYSQSLGTDGFVYKANQAYTYMTSSGIQTMVTAYNNGGATAWSTVTQNASSWSAKIGTGAEAVAAINASASGVTISAAHINLIGAVAGSNFSIGTNGILTCKGANISGTLTAGSSTQYWTFNNNGAQYTDTAGGITSNMRMLSGGQNMAGANYVPNATNYRMFYGSSGCDVQYGSDYSYNMYLRSQRILLIAGSDGTDGTRMAVLGIPDSSMGEGSYSQFTFFPAENNTGNLGTPDRRWNTIRYGSGGCSGTSSRSRKKEINPLEDCGDIIDKLEPVTFRWIDTDLPSAGFILEDVYNILPVVCDVPKANLLHDGGLYYDRFIPFLVKEIQSLRKRVAALESQKG